MADLMKWAKSFLIFRAVIHSLLVLGLVLSMVLVVTGSEGHFSVEWNLGAGSAEHGEN